MDPYWSLQADIPSGDKTFSRFQKGGLPPLKRKVQTPFLKHNKMERIKWTQFGSAIAVPSGDTKFSRFQKGRLPALKRMFQKLFLKLNKMERLTNGPHKESAFADSVLGVKHF